MAGNNKNKKTTPKKTCVNCKKEQNETNFYMSRNKMFTDGRVPICKSCIKDMVDYNNIDTIYNILKQLDLPFLYDTWQSALKSSGDTLGVYIRQINSLSQFSGYTWGHSDFTGNKINNHQKDSIDNQQVESQYSQDIDLLRDKFGVGYKDNEYILFEKKYQELRPSFQLLTTMHEECLREYCIDKVKEGLAKAKGDFKEAKEWASMAKDVANSGKLNPSQMSKADLSGGLDTFGQLARMVEQTDKGELLRILPRFTEKPKDKVDMTLLHYINYVRDLKGMEECKYKDIYEFYTRREKEYEDKTLDEELEEGESNGES